MKARSILSLTRSRHKTAPSIRYEAETDVTASRLVVGRHKHIRCSDDELLAPYAAWARIFGQEMSFIDTAKVHGSGKSEEILDNLIKNHSTGVDCFKS